MASENLEKRLDALYFDRMRALYKLGSAVTIQGEDGVLLCLYAMDRPMLSGELVQRMGLTTGRVANILRMLEAKSLIERVQDVSDRRKVHISLTEAGLLRARERYAQRAQGNRALLDYLGEPDAAHLLDLLERCLDYCDQAE